MSSNYPMETGSANIRKEVLNAMIHQTAARAYKFKQALAIVPTKAWKNSFFREDLTVLTGQSGNSVDGIPRGAAFPQATVNWQEVSVRIVKYGLEENILWEDLLSDEINIQARTVIRLTEGVVKGVDDAIWDALTESRAGTGVIQSFAVATTLGNGAWNTSSAAIIDDLMYASELIHTNGNYDIGNLICFVSPTDHRHMKNYIANKGAQWQAPATKVLENGRMGQIAGITIVESNSVTTSFALVVKPKTCATYKELVSLRSTTIEDPFRSLKIRVVEEGAVELTDPKAIVLINETNQ